MGPFVYTLAPVPTQGMKTHSLCTIMILTVLTCSFMRLSGIFPGVFIHWLTMLETAATHLSHHACMQTCTPCVWNVHLHMEGVRDNANCSRRILASKDGEKEIWRKTNNLHNSLWNVHTIIHTSLAISRMRLFFWSSDPSLAMETMYL